MYLSLQSMLYLYRYPHIMFLIKILHYMINISPMICMFHIFLCMLSTIGFLHFHNTYQDKFVSRQNLALSNNFKYMLNILLHQNKSNMEKHKQHMMYLLKQHKSLKDNLLHIAFQSHTYNILDYKYTHNMHLEYISYQLSMCNKLIAYIISIGHYICML